MFPGNNCEIEVNECLSDPCHSGATCVDHLNAFSCVCQDGFQGIKNPHNYYFTNVWVLHQFFNISDEIYTDILVSSKVLNK